MKLALVVHASSKEPSFRVSDGAAYGISGGKPCLVGKAFSNRIFANIWCVPFLYEGSAYFNHREGLPRDNDFDVVLATYEVADEGRWRNAAHSLTKSPDRFLRDLRSAFPNAAIIAYTKEMHPHVPVWTPQHSRFGPAAAHRPPAIGPLMRRWFRACDAVALPYVESALVSLSEAIDRPVYSLPYPYAIDAIRAAVPSAARSSIMLHATRYHVDRPADSRRAEALAAQLGLELVEGVGMKWPQWLALVQRAQFCLNLDPTPKVGQVAIECAILGTPHVGGRADAAVALFPDTATLDLEQIAASCDRIRQSGYDSGPAFRRVRDRHGFEAVRSALTKICHQLGVPGEERRRAV